MAALAASHQPRPVDRRFLIAASAPTPPQPPPLLAAVLRSRVLALLGSRRGPSCWWLLSPAISSGPWTAASRSQPPSCRRRRNCRHFSQRCFGRAPLARFAARLAWRLWPPAISSGPWAAAFRSQPPRRRRCNRRHFSQRCFAAEHSRFLARLAARPAGGSRRQPSAAARGPPLHDRSLRAAADATTSRSAAVQPSTPWLASLPHPAGGSGVTSHQQRPVGRRFSTAASELPPAATSRSGALQANCSRGSHLPVGGSGLQPANSTTLGPPSLDRSPRAAAAGCQCLTRGFQPWALVLSPIYSLDGHL